MISSRAGLIISFIFTVGCLIAGSVGDEKYSKNLPKYLKSIYFYQIFILIGNSS